MAQRSTSTDTSISDVPLIVMNVPSKSISLDQERSSTPEAESARQVDWSQLIEVIDLIGSLSLACKCVSRCIDARNCRL